MPVADAMDVTENLKLPHGLVWAERQKKGLEM